MNIIARYCLVFILTDAATKYCITVKIFLAFVFAIEKLLSLPLIFENALENLHWNCVQRNISIKSVSLTYYSVLQSRQLLNYYIFMQ